MTNLKLATNLFVIGLVLLVALLTNLCSAQTPPRQQVVEGGRTDEKTGDDVLLRAIRRDVETETENDNSQEADTSQQPVVAAAKPAQNLSDPDVHSVENNHSWTVFFILCILAFSILLIHILIQFNFHYLPESVAVVFLGAIIGLIFKLLSQWKVSDWSKEESFTPTIFFLVLLPPIIFESGYNLHKGNFFQNIGSIMVFAIFGTAISAFVMGLGVYLLGQMNLVFALNAKESFAFGSLVSAVDPVATLAIFNALDIDPVLYMLVFGESILNDAVAIVLTNTIMAFSGSSPGFFYMIGYFIGKFFMMFFASAGIGCLFGMASALLFKYVDLRKTPSLETAFMFIFMYSPYVFAEAIKLSGIMAILFAGLVMSHYTHLNLSSVTRITIQQIFRTLAFISETCVFAYLGLAIFSFKHIFKPSLVISSIIMCLIGRAANIFPLSILLNYFREHKITKKMQFVMWFSGLRGAIAFALALNLDLPEETRHVIVTSTLILVLFTTLVLGGSTMPLMKFLNGDKGNRRAKAKLVTLSKTKEMGAALDPNMSTTDDNNSGGQAGTSDDLMSSVNIQIVRSGVRLRGFARLDETILKPFFTRKFTPEELQAGQIQMNALTKQWFDDANRDNNKPAEPESSKVFYKKTPANGTTPSNSKSYFSSSSNHSAASKILLDSTDEDDDEDDQVIIDQSKLLK